MDQLTGAGSEANLAACEEHQVDAYIPDNHFRQRGPRFATQERHKAPHRQMKEAYGIERFRHAAATDTYICPQGKSLTCQSAGMGAATATTTGATGPKPATALPARSVRSASRAEAGANH